VVRQRHPARRLIVGAHGRAPGPVAERRLPRPAAWEVGEPTSGISYRERQVLQLLADDHTKAGVAAVLGLSPHTIKGYVKALHVQSGTHTPGGLVAWALRRGLVS
jgi:DNA-binding CsgD family transcriptional regulator